MDRYIEFDVEIYNKKTEETHKYTNVLDVFVNGIVLYVQLKDKTFSHWVHDLEYLEYVKENSRHFINFN